MQILKPATAGTLESSDLMVTLEPGNDGIELSLTSSVMNQYGRQIKKTVLETLDRLEVKDAKVTIVDKGALDCTIKARVECAVFRANDASAETMYRVIDCMEKEKVCWQIGEQTYQPGDSLKITKDTTVKAVWEDISVTVLVGDVSGDGIVDQADAMLLARYAAAWEGVELDLKAADLNDDGSVDNADAMILSRYVAGWEDYDKYIVTKTV